MRLRDLTEIVAKMNRRKSTASVFLPEYLDRIKELEEENERLQRCHEFEENQISELKKENLLLRKGPTTRVEG